MSLSKKQINEIVSRYDGGKGESVMALAEAFGADVPAVRLHLKQAGVYNPNADEAPLPQTEDDLGIGEEADPNAALAALLQNPALQQLIDKAVADRVAKLSVQPASSADTTTDQMKAFTASLAHLIEVNAMQQPGYIKPLPAEEIDRRAAGLVEMRSLLRAYEQDRNPPEWLIGASGFFECTNAIEFQPGQTIRTYLPPVEDFMPKNEPARRVHAAMLHWIGGPTQGIGEQVEAAMREAHNSAPLVTSKLDPSYNRPRPVELVNEPLQAPARKRVAGTIVPERHDVSLAERAAGPQGPVFVGDRAA
jgi:hypothetical protein